MKTPLRLALILALAIAVPQGLQLAAHSAQPSNNAQPSTIEGSRNTPTDGETTDRPPRNPGWKAWAG